MALPVGAGSPEEVRLVLELVLFVVRKAARAPKQPDGVCKRRAVSAFERSGFDAREEINDGVGDRRVPY